MYNVVCQQWKMIIDDDNDVDDIDVYNHEDNDDDFDDDDTLTLLLLIIVSILDFWWFVKFCLIDRNWLSFSWH